MSTKLEAERNRPEQRDGLGLLGAGLILDGKLYSGASDMAGEVGHVRLADDGPLGYGKHGSAEGFCSGGGIARAECPAVQAELPE